jgi:hypothetical protein
MTEALFAPDRLVGWTTRAARWGALLVVCSFLVLALGAAPSSAADSTRVEHVRYETFDGIRVPADLYRPAGTSSEGVVLLSDRGSPTASWEPLAQALVERGWSVLVAELRGRGEVGRAGRRRGAGVSFSDPDEVLWRDVLAADAFLRQASGDSILWVIPGGVGLAAAAVAVSASRELTPPPALFLLIPDPELAGIPIGPVLVGLGLPFLVVTTRDETPSAQASRQLYLQARPECELWELEGDGRGTQLLRHHPMLSVDLADWLDRVSHQSGARPPAARDTGAGIDHEGHP